MSDRTPSSRLESLDAARAFALLLGIVYHACGAYLPAYGAAAVEDVSTSVLLEKFVMVSHAFRMELFFLLAGFLGCAVVRRKGARVFARERLVRLGVPFVVGWLVLHPLLASGYIMGAASMRGDYDFWAGIRSGYESFAHDPKGIYRRSHLWFLYYLMMVTCMTLAARAVFVRFPRWSGPLLPRVDRAVRWLSESQFSVPLLVLPTAGVLLLMRRWGVDTPNQSLRPYVPAILLYGGFFGFGWMLSRQSGLIDRFARHAPRLWITVVVGLAGTLLLAPEQFHADQPRRALAHVFFVGSYALMMWSMVFLTIDLCMRWFPQPSDASGRGHVRPEGPTARTIVRYLADSSYWLYLMHLPIVVWLQVAFSKLPVHWTLKIGAITLITLSALLIAYDLLVRPSIVGQILNGRRKDSELIAWWRHRRVAA